MYGRVGDVIIKRMKLLIKSWKSYKEFKVVKKRENAKTFTTEYFSIQGNQVYGITSVEYSKYMFKKSHCLTRINSCQKSAIKELSRVEEGKSL